MSFLESLGLKKTATNPGGNPTNGGQQQQQNNQNPGGNQNGNGGQGNNMDPNANIPGQNNNNVNGSQEPANPMDAWAKMFDNPKEQEGDKAPAFTIDDEVLGNVSGQLDFTKDVDPELMQRATSGDMQALMQVMNHVGRGAYKNAMKHNSSLTDKFIGMREEHFSTKRIPGMLRDELTMNSLGGGNSKMSPTTRKQLAETAKRIQKLYPESSPEEVGQMARKYISDMYKELNPDAQNQGQEGGQKKEAAPTDWDAWADAQ